MALALLSQQLALTRNHEPQRHALTPVEDESSAYAVGSSHQVADSGAPLRQSCSFAMHRAQQDPAIDGRTPPDWENNEYSTELWLARRWATYPQAQSAFSSDFAFVAFNQSLLCNMKKKVTISREWTQQVVPFAESLGKSKPVVIANLLEHCPPPRQRPSNVLLLREVTLDSLSVPFVVSSPAWLVRWPSLGQDPYAVPWAERKLLFFGGRAPKPKISAVRYRVWQQLRGEPRATSHVHSLWCDHAVGCVATQELEARGCNKRVVEQAGRATCQQDNATLQEMLRTDEILPRDTYLRTLFSHRFCLVVRGDANGTPKLTEVLAAGGAGGCVPVFVFDKGSRFPYDTVLDYCQLGVFVSPRKAETRLSEVIDALERLTPAQVEAKRTALRRARHRFVFRNDSSFAHPSAAEHTYEQVCAALRGKEATMKRAWHMDQCEL